MHKDRRDAIISWFEDVMDGRTLRWFVKNSINASVDLDKEKVIVENNDSVKANDHWHKIIEGIKCLFTCHFNAIRNIDCLRDHVD